MTRASWPKCFRWTERAARRVAGVIGRGARRDRGRLQVGEASPAQTVEAIRLLCALLRSGLTPRSALIRWHAETTGPVVPHLVLVARRLALGAPTDVALAGLRPCFGSDGRSIEAIFAVHGVLGGDVATMLDGLAAAIERRQSAIEAARATSAGARLSAYLIAALPLVALLIAPAARAPLTDGAALAVAIPGIGLAATGFVWISRLTPVAPASDEPVAAIAHTAATLLRGGASLAASLDVVASHSPEDLLPTMQRARRLVHLGMPWTDALVRAGDSDVASLAGIVRRASLVGVPVAAALESFAESKRAERMRAFEAATKRAPVLMTVPLAVCVLPSFVLLGIAPYVRGLSMGW